MQAVSRHHRPCDSGTRSIEMGQHMSAVKRTPLADIHESLGARMVEFAGFLMPVMYGSILREHEAVRQRVGLFDVSHMGEILVTGDRAREFVDEVITNDCSEREPGEILYTVMCRRDGTVVDDLLVFVVGEDRIILVVNAANCEKDLAHIGAFATHGVEVRDISADLALVAVQGPRSREVLRVCPLFGEVRQMIDHVPYYRGFSFSYQGDEVLVSRTGYTGELGFEIFLPPSLAPLCWEAIMQAGQEFGIEPIGLGARDTLRFEASYCLYGHELDDTTSPYEAGLGWVVRLKKDRFCGLEALRREKERGAKRTLIGLALDGRNIARQGYQVFLDGEEVGLVTSGAFAPTLEASLCMARIESRARRDGGKYSVKIRGKDVAARQEKLPFYKSRAK